MPALETKARRAPRRSAREIAALLVAAGKEIVLSEGLAPGVHGLTFKKVLEKLRTEQGIALAHASIIGRAFPDQAAFQHRVLVELIHDTGNTELSDTSAVISTILQAADRTTLEGRLSANNDVIRLGAFANEQALRHSPTWPVWIGIVAAEAARSQHDPVVTDELRRVVAKEMRDFAELYGHILDFLGLGVRAPFTLTDLTIAISAVAEGAMLRQQVLPEPFATRTVAPRPGEPAQAWSLTGLAIRGVSDFMVEPLSDWSPTHH
jgi:hypothetical protein